MASQLSLEFHVPRGSSAEAPSATLVNVASAVAAGSRLVTARPTYAADAMLIVADPMVVHEVPVAEL
jgi:hypothetical protein